MLRFFSHFHETAGRRTFKNSSCCFRFYCTLTVEHHHLLYVCSPCWVPEVIYRSKHLQQATHQAKELGVFPSWMLSKNPPNYRPRQVLTRIFKRSTMHTSIAPQLARIPVGPVKPSFKGLEQEGWVGDPVTQHCSPGCEAFVLAGALGRILIQKNAIKEIGFCPAAKD